MDKRLKYMVYMWREFNDDWYRIQTNYQPLIRKLRKRTGRNKTQIIGKTLVSSSHFWLIFRVKYNKPSTAKQSFMRLTNCRNNFTVKNGVISTEIVHKMDSKMEDEV
jgi:hypothetical protein